jgi:hypothetical protein
MDFPNNPPKVGKTELLDNQFADWWLFLNTWGISAFVLFLGSLGAGEHKYFCAILSSALLGWGYWVARGRFPSFIIRLRKGMLPQAKNLEKEIFRDHFFKRLLEYFPFLLGMSTIGTLSIWPLVTGNWRLYFLFWPL